MSLYQEGKKDSLGNQISQTHELLTPQLASYIFLIEKHHTFMHCTLFFRVRLYLAYRGLKRMPCMALFSATVTTVAVEKFCRYLE